MKDKRKIVLGTKDVFPLKNNDIFLNVELSKSSDELVNEIIDNNFNLLDQFNTEREQSLKFCVYGTLNSIFSDTENLEITIRTNHNDEITSPRIETGAIKSVVHKITSKPLSQYNKLSKNIFKKNKSSFYFMFELSPFYNNVGETKSLLISINNRQRKVYAELEVPFLYFDADGQKVLYGTETVDVDIDGNEQIIENDFPFLYDTHWVKTELNLARPLFATFSRSLDDSTNNITVDESDGKITFYAGLDFPSVYGKENLEVYIKEDNTIRNPNEDYLPFEPKKLTWEIGEQYKKVEIDLIDDLFVESAETIVFGFRKLDYVEALDSSVFTLNINDKDKPINTGFSSGLKTITASATTLTFFVTLESKMNVPGQTVDVVFDNELSTAILGEDLENTGTEDAPEFRKTVNFTQGSNIGTFEVEIFEIFKYDFDKTAIFRFENPSQNVKIDESRDEFTLTIKNSLIPRYTTYNLANDREKGHGIFRLSEPSLSPLIPVSLALLSEFNPLGNNNSSGNMKVSTSFRCTLQVINRGDQIIFENKIVGPNEVVKEFDIRDGYLPISIELISNFNMNFQNRQYENSKYEFLFTEIESLDYPSGGFGVSALPAPSFGTFDDFSIESQSLSSSLEKSEINYYLVTTIGRLRTRLEPNTDYQETLDLIDLINNSGIEFLEPKSQVKTKIKEYLDLGTPPLFNTVPNPLGITLINLTTFVNENYNKINQYLSEPISPPIYLCKNSLQAETLDVKINGILFITKTYTSQTVTDVFSFQNTVVETDTTRIIESKFEKEQVVYTYCEGSQNNQVLPPAQPI